MPGLLPPGDRVAAEEALSETQRAALREMLSDLRCAPEAWPAIPSLRSVVELVATARIVELEELRGASQAEAFRAAGTRLDVDHESARKRWDRWRGAARTHMSMILRELCAKLERPK